MEHHGGFTNATGNDAAHRGQPNQSNGGNSGRPTIHQPYLKNEDLRKFQHMASQFQPITLDNLSSVRSFKINNEREYQMTMLLCHKLTEEMTRYRLERTPSDIIARLEKAPGDSDESSN